MQLQGTGTLPPGFQPRVTFPAYSPSMLRCAEAVIAKEGALALYKGLSASLLRQATFIGTKFGTYDVLKDLTRKNWCARPNPIGSSTRVRVPCAWLPCVGCGATFPRPLLPPVVRAAPQ
jgi:hypothetical protein